MNAALSTNLADLVGLPVARVQEELKRGDIDVRTVADAVAGPLAVLVSAGNASSAPPGSKVIAYTAKDRVTRFVIDTEGSQQAAFNRQQTSIESLLARVEAPEAEVKQLKAERPGRSRAKS